MARKFSKSEIRYLPPILLLTVSPVLNKNKVIKFHRQKP